MVRSSNFTPEHSFTIPEPLPCPPRLSDEELIGCVIAGARDAADELFRRYLPLACQLAYRMLGNHEDADDAVQEAFTSVLGYLINFEGRASFETWLRTIVRNAAFNLGRKRQRRGKLLEGLRRDDKYLKFCQAVKHHNPLRELIEHEDEERAQAVERELKRVLETNKATPRMCRVYWMRDKGLSFRKIAKALGCLEREVRRDMRDLWSLVLTESAAANSSVA